MNENNIAQQQIIYSADWVLPISESPIKDGAVAVAGNQIMMVGRRCELLQQLPDYQEHSLGATAIMPGLVNVHSHLELTVMRNFLEHRNFRYWIRTLTEARRRLQREDLSASATWGAAEAARAGITTLADTGDTGAALDGLLTLGLRGVVFQEVFSSQPGEAETRLAQLKEKVANLQARTNCLVRIGVSPHTVYTVSARLFGLVADYARQQELPMAIHAAESVMEVALVRDGRGEFAEDLAQRQIIWRPSGTSVIQYLANCGALDASPLLIHAVQLESGDLRLITDSNSQIAHCPKSNSKFGHGRARLEEIKAAGVKVGLGTDSVASNNICDLLEEARVAVFIHQSAIGAQDDFSPRAMLEMMTLGGATALGLADQIGTLTAGKQADLIAIDLTHMPLVPLNDIEAALLYCASGRDVCLTVVAGREIYRDGRLLTVDESAILPALQQATERLSG
jgi:cytosine/adenosine deaminase-related metal-dependent hydrolase